MKFSYPTNDIEETNDKTPLESFYENEKKGGFYPIGKSNVWHGGIHIEKDDENGICAIAGGEIVAVRIPKKYIVDKKKIYSNGFVLIRHKYEYTAIRYGFVDTRRRHTRVDVYAGFLGAIIQFRLEGHQHYIVSNGFTYEDNSCHPSSAHTNGRAGDLYYLSTLEDGSRTLLGSANFDYDNQVILCNILIDYGFQGFCSEHFSNVVNASTGDNNPNTLLPNARHITVPRHDNHLHIENFRQIHDIYELSR